MILKTLKSNRSINLLLFPAIALLFWTKSLIHPFSYHFLTGESNTFLFAPIYNLTFGLHFVRVLISLVLVIILGFLVQMINDRYSFIRIRTKLPATLFIIIVSGFTQIHTLHPVFPAAVFFLFAIYNLFGTFEEKKPYAAIFNAGLFIGIGTLFYFNLIIVFPAFFVGIAILSREITWRGHLILLIGFLVPLFYSFGFAVITGQISQMLETVSNVISTPLNHFRNNLSLHILLAFLTLLTLGGSIKIMQQYDSKKVSTRKYFTIFFIIFVLSMVSIVFVPGTSQEMLIIIAIPITYLISNLFVFMKRRFLSELLFILLVGIVIFMQFSERFF